MRKFIILLFILPLLTACNDGDVILVGLEFENTFQTCGNLVFFKTKTDPPESLSIFIDDLTLEQIVATVDRDTTLVFQDVANPVITRVLDGTTKKLNYRTYTALPTDPFCTDVPSSQLNIISDSEGTGTFTITTTLIEDDNDGIPAEFEDINGNGILDDDDTDGDGIPNYLDDDDDGDNVKTIDEFVNFDVANNLLNALDTDGDTTPNYLDEDDDGDEVLTRDEESILPNNNPADDVTDPTPDPITNTATPDYLNNQVTATAAEPVTSYSAHVIIQTFRVQIEITNLSIPQLSQDYLNFGLLNAPTITTKVRNPPTIFN